jgi:hypothetical protein
MPQVGVFRNLFSLFVGNFVCGGLCFLRGFLQIVGANRGVNDGEMWWSCGDLVRNDGKARMKNGTA